MTVPDNTSETIQVSKTHPKHLQIHRKEGFYTSYATSLVTLPAGAVFAPINTHSSIPHPTWASVQSGRNSHIDLNSDLVFINHSCEPSLEFDMKKMCVCVSRNRADGIKKGDLLTFFYPSTEWSMIQVFDCLCGEKTCRGKISGAKDMGRKLEGNWLNDHIVQLLSEKAMESKL